MWGYFYFSNQDGFDFDFCFVSNPIIALINGSATIINIIQ